MNAFFFVFLNMSPNHYNVHFFQFFKEAWWQIMLLVCLQNMLLCLLFGIFRSACLFVCLVAHCAVCFWTFYLPFSLITVVLLLFLSYFYLVLYSSVNVMRLHVFLLLFIYEFLIIQDGLQCLDEVTPVLTCMCVCLFCDGVQLPVGRTSLRRMGWWPCLPVRPAPGLSQPSWPVICSWPTFCWSTFS